MKAVASLKNPEKKDRRIMGIDSSTMSVAASIFERRAGEVFLVDAMKIDYSNFNMDEKLIMIGSFVPEILKKYGPIDHVYIEQPIYIQNPQTSRKLSQIVGHIWGTALQTTVATETSIAEWKKFIGYKNVSAGEKKAWIAEMGEKEAKKRAAFERKNRTITIVHDKIAGIDHITDNDICDSIGIGLYGISLL